MKNKFKKYYISHHVITLKRFVTRLIRYLHNIKHFYICKTSFKYCLSALYNRAPHKETHKETHKIKPHKKAHKITLKKTYKKIHITGHKNMI